MMMAVFSVCLCTLVRAMVEDRSCRSRNRWRRGDSQAGQAGRPGKYLFYSMGFVG